MTITPAINHSKYSVIGATLQPNTTLEQPARSSATVVGALRAACGRIAPLWPLENFVAVNPYFGLADLTFEAAAARLATAAEIRSTLPARFYLDAVAAGRITLVDITDALGAHPGAASDADAFLLRAQAISETDQVDANRVSTVAEVAAVVTGVDWSRLCVDRISAWASTYFDDGQASWSSADDSAGAFAAWRAESSIDRTAEVMGLRGFRSFVRALPSDPVVAAELAIVELDIPAEVVEIYAHALLLRVGGWAAHTSRLSFEAVLAGGDDDTIVNLLAIALAWEVAFYRHLSALGHSDDWDNERRRFAALGAAPKAGAALADLLILQDAFDRAEQRRIASTVSSGALQAAATGLATCADPAVQAVFCIDVRSEVMRRHLESVAPTVATIGFAGFFGFPIAYVPLGHVEPEGQCPVLLSPAATVAETVPGGRQTEAIERRQLEHHVRRAWKSFKMGAISCFSFVGPVGLAYLPKLFRDGSGRSRPVTRPEDEGLPRWAVESKRPDLAPNANVGIPLDQRIAMAAGALRAMSLAQGFARLVLLVGHGSTTSNNPYGTGLDCGACGGHTGEANARVAAAIFNDAEVRVGLAEMGIHIPPTTWFVAALHDTTVDVVSIFDRSEIPESHLGEIDHLEGWFAQAGKQVRRERAPRLGIAGVDDDGLDDLVFQRASDWAQVRPEWGLAGCRAFIVAPRERTQAADLQGQAFLHSYDWRADHDFGVLKLIMTAPMVVASWISLQYYASTVDNAHFGSGNKTLHNVVGRIGVLEGNGGDLRVGLPWQSVHDGTNYQHEPLRLNVVIEAPLDAIDSVIASHDHVRHLLDNGWVHLLAMDESGRVSHRYAGGLRWEELAHGPASLAAR